MYTPVRGVEYNNNNNNNKILKGNRNNVLIININCPSKFIYAFGNKVGHKDPLSPGKGESICRI